MCACSTGSNCSIKITFSGNCTAEFCAASPIHKHSHPKHFQRGAPVSPVLFSSFSDLKNFLYVLCYPLFCACMWYTGHTRISIKERNAFSFSLSPRRVVTIQRSVLILYRIWILLSHMCSGLLLDVSSVFYFFLTVYLWYFINSNIVQSFAISPQSFQ